MVAVLENHVCGTISVSGWNSGTATSTQNPSYDYQAFGEIYAATTSETIENRYQYTGREMNPVSDRMFFRVRGINNYTGRFFQRAPEDVENKYEGHFFPNGTDPYGLPVDSESDVREPEEFDKLLSSSWYDYIPVVGAITQAKKSSKLVRPTEHVWVDIEWKNMSKEYNDYKYLDYRYEWGPKKCKCYSILYKVYHKYTVTWKERRYIAYYRGANRATWEFVKIEGGLVLDLVPIGEAVSAGKKLTELAVVVAKGYVTNLALSKLHDKALGKGYGIIGGISTFIKDRKTTDHGYYEVIVKKEEVGKSLCEDYATN